MSDIFKLRLILQKIEELKDAVEDWDCDNIALREVEDLELKFYRKLEFHEKQQVSEKKP